mmetsp:Transcript_8307/g.19470  ORF Transcript_8307/g.19470 Transcript_8307/m.19470 type:complete len:210 (+) Transcript_8307:430-1059(+)
MRHSGRGGSPSTSHRGERRRVPSAQRQRSSHQIGCCRSTASSARRYTVASLSMRWPISSSPTRSIPREADSCRCTSGARRGISCTSSRRSARSARTRLVSHSPPSYWAQSRCRSPTSARAAHPRATSHRRSTSPRSTAARPSSSAATMATPSRPRFRSSTCLTASPLAEPPSGCPCYASMETTSSPCTPRRDTPGRWRSPRASLLSLRR